MKNRELLSLLLVLCVAQFLGSCSRPASAEGARHNVILICLDTVRADHLGAYGYEKNVTTPGLDSLADRSTLFSDVSANSGWTKPSVPTYMTGLYPVQHGVYEGNSRDSAGEEHSDVLPASALTIAEVFQEAGYSTAAFVRNAQIRKGQGIEQGFDIYQDGAGDAKDIRWRALDWLDQRDEERPFFLYLHLLDAHFPYPVPDEYGALFSSMEAISLFRTKEWKELRERVNDGEQVLTQEQLDALIALYDGALRYIDDQLMLLMQGLDQRGLAGDTVISIISDHGEEFLEHGKIGHGHGLHEELLSVPWILHVPGREPEVIETPVSLVDLFPTLLHAADLPVVVDCEGVDRLDQPMLWRESYAEHKAGRRYQQSVRRGDHKLIRYMESTGAPGVKVEAPTVVELVEKGDRLAVGLRLDADGTPVAAEVKLRGGSDDPIEIKGTIQAIDDDGFVLAGIHVPLLKDVVLYGNTKDAEGKDVPLEVGLGVKVKIRSSAGAYLGYRVKLYARDSKIENELRGIPKGIDESSSVARLDFGFTSVVLDEKTVVEAPAARDHSLTREDLRALLLAGGASWKPFTHLVELYALEGDGRVEVPFDDPTGVTGMSGLLDTFGAERAQRPLWSSADRSVLSQKDLHELMEIGYAGGED